jgi:lipoprotein-anchoring transpeptidase ErfK/SrfK
MPTPVLQDLPPDQAIWLEVDTTHQHLCVRRGEETVAVYPVSTGAAGTGQREGSGQTPLGWHYVRAVIGEGEPVGSVFRGRRPTGERFSAELAAAYPQRDWILTRILWLCGLEPGHNRGGDVDSQRRYIYLHGTPPDQPIGMPGSHGCIRLRDDDLLAVFAVAKPGTPVWVHVG